MMNESLRTKPTPTGQEAETLTGAAPDPVPARMLNEYAYCPRLAYLEWVQGEFDDSVDTIEGRFQHRRVDRPFRRAALPHGQRSRRPRSGRRRSGNHPRPIRSAFRQCPGSHRPY